MSETFKESNPERYEQLGRELSAKGIDINHIKKKLSNFNVEVPSWLFGTFGGGRFSGYLAPGAARNIYEKFDDAAFTYELTGATPLVSIQAGQDDPDEATFDEVQSASFKKLKDYAQGKKIGIGTVNPTYFLEGTQFGSLSANDPKTRSRMVDHSLLAAEIAEKYGIGIITVWTPDGSLYPGQLDMRTALRYMKDSLKQVYEKMPSSVQMLIEYKLFEPGTYHTVISDIFSATELARSLGERAGVLVDLGHHPHGVNVEYIVTRLIEAKMLTGLHLNTRYAADDDHAVEPNMQIFRIFHELVVSNVDGNWLYTLDQCSALENRILAVLHSVDSLMVSHAKALIVDKEKLREHQNKNEILLANRTLVDAFLTDVRPILYKVRLEKGLPIDPVEEYLKSGYQQRIEDERQ